MSYVLPWEDGVETSRRGRVKMPSEPAPLALYVVVRPPGGSPYTLTLDRLTAQVRAARTLRTMGRLAEKLARASNAVAGVELAVERDVDALVERTQAVHKKREAAFLAQHQNLDAQMTDLAEFERELDDFGKNDHSGVGGSAYTGTTPKT